MCNDLVENQNAIQDQRALPVEGKNRIVSLDVLRGLAVLGILIMNIQVYSMTGIAFKNPYAWGDFTGINKAVWLFGHIFAAGKFFGIFSMLFGAGIILITDKAEKKSGKSMGLHFSRNIWLMIIGCVHAYMLWYGDILFAYGLCAIPVFFMRKFSPKTLLIVGLILVMIGSGITVLSGLTIDQWPEESRKSTMERWQPTQDKLQAEIDIKRGSWAGVVAYRYPILIGMQTFGIIFYTGWVVMGMMLIGMALFKWGIVTCERSSSFYLKGFMISFPVSLAVILWGLMKHFENGFSFKYSMMLGAQYNFWGSIVMSFSYICLVMYVYKAGLFKKAVAALQKVGQMALSNYLLQTIICVVIFYGTPGLGLFSRLERWEQAVVVLAVWFVLTLFSVKWMERYRFGPFEWIWRSLTYRKVQPLRKND